MIQNNMKRLENKTAFITGGLSGIGKECALAAAKEGANIVIADLKSEITEKTMAVIRKENSKAIFVECDVSEFAQVQAAINKAISAFGTLDIALNNAGIGGEANKVGDMSKEGWLKVININLNGVFYCMKLELVQMSKQKSGVIVNMSSILGKVGFANSSNYVAAKHGILGLTQTAALEYAAEGIRINAICPGFIDTPLLTNAGISENTDLKKYIMGLHPFKRLGKPEEIAADFIFLASEDSSFMTGSAIEVDGGYLAQ
jgi:NAD(P)-dependent dehydrogenase (short-subunit alcohol dehydrogenase family)